MEILGRGSCNARTSRGAVGASNNFSISSTRNHGWEGVGGEQVRAKSFQKRNEHVKKGLVRKSRSMQSRYWTQYLKLTWDHRQIVSFDEQTLELQKTELNVLPSDLREESKNKESSHIACTARQSSSNLLLLGCKARGCA